jgi:signal transduction histidine kinase
VELMEAIARQAALALHHSRVVERSRSEERSKTILEERNRLARDIHDNLAQGFAAILMQLQGARRELSSMTPTASTSVDTAIELARTHLAEARRSVGTLRPTVGSGEDVATAIRRLADLGQRTTGVPIDVLLEELPRAGDGVEREIVSIAQEALTNALRHAEARRITIRAPRVRGAIDRASAVGGRRWPRHRARAEHVRLRDDQHAGTGRQDRGFADHRDRAAQRHRSGARVGALGAADAGARRCLRPPSPA